MEDHGPGVGAHVGDRLPARLAALDPEDEVAEGEVCDELPVPHDEVEPLDLGRLQGREGLEVLGEGRHADQA